MVGMKMTAEVALLEVLKSTVLNKCFAQNVLGVGVAFRSSGRC